MVPNRNVRLLVHPWAIPEAFWIPPRVSTGSYMAISAKNSRVFTFLEIGDQNSLFLAGRNFWRGRNFYRPKILEVRSVINLSSFSQLSYSKSLDSTTFSQNKNRIHENVSGGRKITSFGLIKTGNPPK